MLVIMKTPIDLAMWVKIHNLIVSRKGSRDGAVAVDLLSRTDFRQLVPGEKVILVAHGNETHFGGYDATSLARVLFDKDLPYDVKSIKLSGCKSAAPGKPYCLELARELYKVSILCKPPLTVDVTGMVDTAVTFPDGRVRAKKVHRTPTEGPTYEQIIARYDDPKLKSQKIPTQMELWKQLAASMPYGDQQEIIASAALVAKATTAMFDELYKLNEQITRSKEEGRVQVRWH